MTRRLRLPLRFDADALCADLALLEPEDWIPHFNTADYEGEWSGVALRSVGGRAGHIYADPAPQEPFADTALLGRCPNLSRAVASFPGELLSVRLLRLGPGAAIREHRDVGLGYGHGEVRLHVPLSTSGDVEFRHDGELVRMAPGETWYLDLSLPHSVANRSDADRIHLVVDCRVGPWLRGLLEPDDAPATERVDPSGPADVDTGESPLGMPLLERFRASLVPEPGTRPVSLAPAEFVLARAVFDTLGVGLEEVCTYLFRESPDAQRFEDWILGQHGGRLDSNTLARARTVAGGERPAGPVDAPAVLSARELEHFERDGYIVVPDAVPAAARQELQAAIWSHLGADPDRPDSWYGLALQHGIMVQLFRAPGIAEIHASPRIRGAFAQLIGTSDLVMSADRCGFNAPVRAGHPYGGSGMHLDLDSAEPPVPFGLQGLLYLTDTDEQDGAFRCVPAFHHQVDAWLAALPAGRSPSSEDFEAMSPRSVPGRAGDLVIWHQGLPHGPQANTGERPRIVHYLRMYRRPLP